MAYEGGVTRMGAGDGAQEGAKDFVRADAVRLVVLVLGILAFRLSAWTLFSVGLTDASDRAYAWSRLVQMLAIVAVIAVSAATALSRRSLVRVTVLATVAMSGGAVLAVCGAPGGIVFSVGRLVHGLASAWLLLGWGARTCLLPPRQACPAVAVAFALYGLVTFYLQDVLGAVVGALAPAMPVVGGALLALSFGRDGGDGRGLARARVSRDALRGLNYGAVVLLALCAVVCSMTSVFITPAQSVLVRYTTNVFRVVVFAAIAALVLAWVLVLRRDDPDRLWPLYAAVVFFGLLGYSTFSLLDDVASVSFMNATQECLMMFAWMFVSGAAHRHGLPELATFGVGALLFMRTDLPAAALGLLAPGFAQARAAAGATASVVAAFVMAAALIVYTIALLMRSALRADRDLEGTGGGADVDAPAVPRIAGSADRPSSGAAGAGDGVAGGGAGGPRPVVPRGLLDAYGLSEREAQVADLLLRGYTLPQVGERIGISLNTVRYHAKGVYRKLGIHSKAELVAIAEAWGTRRGDSPR